MDTASDNRPAPTSRLRRLVRTLRNLAALGLLTLSFGVLALWVRSQVRLDSLIGTGWEKSLTLSSFNGQCYFILAEAFTYGFEDPSSVSLVSRSSEEVLKIERWITGQGGQSPLSSPGSYGLGFRRHPLRIYVPHWFVALVVALLAFALKPKPRLKFSLADLLVLMTFSAMLIAGVAGMSRLASA